MEIKEIAQTSSEKILTILQTNISGLTEKEALLRQKKYGLNLIHKRRVNLLETFIRQLTGNPLLIILAVATFVSFLLGERGGSYYIFIMIILSVVLGVTNEYSAQKTIDTLLKKISLTALVMREAEKKEIPVSQLTLGDIVLLSQGSIIPADLRLIETSSLEVDESSLTGESKTVYKASVVGPKKETQDQPNIARMGTTVESGSAKGVVIRIGKDTEFGKIAKTTTYIKPTTEFQKGLAGFGQIIIKVIIVLTIAIFLVNAILGHQLLESLLFSLAIAVGLTPELLPLIVTISLSHGAGILAKKSVIAKRLISIENLGNMDVLATDKTGTLTEGKIQVVDYLNVDNKRSTDLLVMSLLCNSALVHHKIIGNAIDAALWQYAQKYSVSLDPETKKLYEEPFDYNRKLMFTVITKGNQTTLIAKGAPESIIPSCKGTKNKNAIEEKIISLRKDGLRVIALGYKKVSPQKSYSFEDVEDLTLEGYITFLDTPKPTAKDAILRLENLNVETKIITGDNELVTQKVCKEVGIEIKGLILGSEIDTLNDEDLKISVNKNNVFARATPQQKLRIIQSLKDSGHTVGFLGDGINDIPALHDADVGISVNTAVDVAKDTASIVLLRKSLDVLADGIIEGRKTFANTIKYILMGTSSNFGNMFSAAGASFFLPFLPMTPVQILLTNSLYDISQTSIPTDNVDSEYLIKPRHWNIDFIKKYMLFFGPLSSLYDFLTFFIMIFVFNASGKLFQTGWFIESLATEILVVFVIRTARSPFYKSRPSKWLTITCLGVVLTGILIPFTPLAKPLGFLTPPPLYFAILILLVTTYLFLVEKLKNIFLRRYTL